MNVFFNYFISIVRFRGTLEVHVGVPSRIFHSGKPPAGHQAGPDLTKLSFTLESSKLECLPVANNHQPWTNYI
jgi:hypothetical protein